MSKEKQRDEIANILHRSNYDIRWRSNCELLADEICNAVFNKQSEFAGFVVFECRKCGCVLHVETIEEMSCLPYYDCPNCGEEPEDNWLFVRLDKER